MLNEFIQGAFLVFQWPAFGFLLIGILAGLWLGAVPGLGGALGIVLALPFTYGMEPAQAIALLLGIYAVTATSDTIPSVMLGIPGTAASQATVLDGHPLARMGQAGRAFGAAFTVSAIGGIIGAVILAVSLPIALPIILKFNNPELFMLGLTGLVMVASLSGKSLLKGLIAACFGLLISSIGYADMEPIPRYWLGTSYLLDKLPLVPVVLGIFAVPELMDLALKNRSIAKVTTQTGGKGLLLQGIGDALKNWWLVVRCSAIGVYIGMIPGLGGAVVDWIAYGHAHQSSKNNENFGKGDIRGVIAPEAANNAVRGGSLIPTIAFGVPGSAMNALLLSALLIQGLQPGKSMLTTNLDLTFSMVWTLAVANVIAAVMLMYWSNWISKLAFISGHLIVPGAMLFILMGSWSTSADLGDWVTLLVFSIIGYLMKQGDWPRPPVILAFILGSLMENSFLLSMMIYEGPSWLGRPIVLILLGIVVLTLFYSLRGHLKLQSKKKTEKKEAFNDAEITDEAEDETQDLPLSIIVSVVLLAIFVIAIIAGRNWPQSVISFPMIGAVPGILLCTFVLVREMVITGQTVGILGAFTVSAKSPLNLRAVKFFAYLIATILLALVIGQKLAIPLFIFAYMKAWGGYGNRHSAIYATACWLVLVAFYDRVVHILWQTTPIVEFVNSVAPDWFPVWLMF